MSQEEQIESDLGLLHYGKQIVDRVYRVRKDYPSVRLGISLLGRAYLIPVLDAVLPKEVALQSMEASICWNRKSRVPMKLFGGLGDRERFLAIERLNKGLAYLREAHPRVLPGAREELGYLIFKTERGDLLPTGRLYCLRQRFSGQAQRPGERDGR